MRNLKEKFMLTMAVSALLFANSFNADAQKAEFGLRFMPTFTAFEMKTSTGGTVKGEVRLGYGAGIIAGFNFSKNFGIQGEIIYTSLSQKYKEANVTRKINLRYFNIPLLLSINSGKDRTVNFNIVGGPQLGISAGSSLTTTGDDGTSTSKGILSVKKGDLGLAYGAGLDFGINKAKTFRVGLGFRGVFGLFDISDNSKTTATDSYYLLDRTKLKTYSAYTGISLLF